MVVNAIYPRRYWKAEPVVCKHVWLSQLSFRPYALLPPETWIWIHSQNSKTNSNESAQFYQFSSCILELCCGCLKESSDDMNHLCISVPWHVAHFYRCFLFAFTSPTSLVPRVLVLASLVMDSCFPFAKSRQVQFSLVLQWGQLLQRQKFISRSHWTVCWT